SPRLAGPLGPASPVVLTLLGVNFVLILALGALVGWRVLMLAGARSEDAGARLHLRFVALFALAAVLPALIVALFFGVLVTRGVEDWFNDRVQTVVENSAKVARSYLNEQAVYIGDHAVLIARELNSLGPSELAQKPVGFSQYLGQQAAENGFSAAYVIDREGRILASARSTSAPEFLTPAAQTVANADASDEVEVKDFPDANVFRGLYRLRAFPDAYLYLVRPVEPGVFSHLRES